MIFMSKSSEDKAAVIHDYYQSDALHEVDIFKIYLGLWSDAFKQNREWYADMRWIFICLSLSKDQQLVHSLYYIVTRSVGSYLHKA